MESLNNKLILPASYSDRRAVLDDIDMKLSTQQFYVELSDAKKKEKVVECQKEEFNAFIRGCVGVLAQTDENLIPALHSAYKQLLTKGDAEARELCKGWLNTFITKFKS